MNIVAVETSGDWCSVALWRDGRVDAREMEAGQKQSGLLIDMLMALLAECGVTLKAIDGFAYGAGPGSFTGLRIACGVVQGLAMGVNRPVAGVGALLALAEASGKSKVVCCVDARMKEVYHAAYEKCGADWRVVHEPGVYVPGDVPALAGEGWHGRGNAFSVYGEALRARYSSSVSSVDAAAYPHAREIATLAAPVFARGDGVAPEHAAPQYVRDRVALKIHER